MLISESINYRSAKPDDSESILALNIKWSKAFFDGFKEKGFLKNPFTFEQILKLIESKEIVVAENNSKVIGYYLINSIFENDVIKERREIIDKLVSKNELPSGRYVYLTQAAIELEYMGKGVAKNLLKELKQLVSERFDFLIGNIDKENHNAREAHLRSGWKIIFEIEKGHLAVTETNSIDVF
jgi:hypothetical protein